MQNRQGIWKPGWGVTEGVGASLGPWQLPYVLPSQQGNLACLTWSRLHEAALLPSLSAEVWPASLLLKVQLRVNSGEHRAPQRGPQVLTLVRKSSFLFVMMNYKKKSEKKLYNERRATQT